MSSTIQYTALLKNKDGDKKYYYGMENAKGHVIGVVSPIEYGISGTYVIKVGVKSHC